MSAIGMPPNLLILFAPRPPLEFEKPVTKRKMPDYEGLTDFVQFLPDNDVPPARPDFETPKQRAARRKKEKLAQYRAELQDKIDNYDPASDPNAESDPKKTLFVSRIAYTCNEAALREEFGRYGPIKRLRLVQDSEGRSRGYAFIEYEHEKDMKAAYKTGDGLKIDGRRVCVDVERARMVKGWTPRRLGGGRGPARGSQPPKGKATLVPPARSFGSRDPTGNRSRGYSSYDRGSYGGGRGETPGYSGGKAFSRDQQPRSGQPFDRDRRPPQRNEFAQFGGFGRSLDERGGGRASYLDQKLRLSGGDPQKRQRSRSR